MIQNVKYLAQVNGICFNISICYNWQYFLLDRVLQYCTSWSTETVRLHSNGDSSHDNFVSASHFPFPTTHQLVFPFSQLGLHLPCSWCLYSCRYGLVLYYKTITPLITFMRLNLILQVHQKMPHQGTIPWNLRNPQGSSVPSLPFP